MLQPELFRALLGPGLGTMYPLNSPLVGPVSTTHGGGFTLSPLLLNVKHGNCKYKFL